MAPTSSRPWPPPSTADRARRSGGERLPRLSTPCCDPVRLPRLSTPCCDPVRLVLRRPIESGLCLLLLLRLPRTRLVYLTSQPVAGPIVDYYLHLLPGVPHRHAGHRLSLFCCHDAGPQPLSAKVLARPRLLGRIRQAI